MNFTHFAPEVQEVLERCALACEQEAVAEDLPPQLGREIFNGCMESEWYGWKQEQHEAWVRQMEAAFKPQGVSADAFIDLYQKCSITMENYVPLLKSVAR